MSLQGTIETFAIADVIRLLAATNKSGRLQVQGPARAGTVWVDSATILGAESLTSPFAVSAAEVLFQMLRFERGSFRFELDKRPPCLEQVAKSRACRLVDGGRHRSRSCTRETVPDPGLT